MCSPGQTLARSRMVCIQRQGKIRNRGDTEENKKNGMKEENGGRHNVRVEVGK